MAMVCAVLNLNLCYVSCLYFYSFFFVLKPFLAWLLANIGVRFPLFPDLL
jgi:hypothetical protein